MKRYLFIGMMGFVGLLSGCGRAEPGLVAEEVDEPAQVPVVRADLSKLPRYDASLDIPAICKEKFGTDDAGLLEYLRKEAENQLEPQEIEKLIRQLGNREFKQREEASEKLGKAGLPALPKLKEAAKDQKDAEVALRAKACADKISKEWRINLPLIAVRKLTERRPEGTVEALLRDPPYAIDEETEEEIWDGLDDLAIRNGKIYPALMAALQDAKPARRAVAACIIGRVGTEKQQAEVKKLLSDTEPMVRLRAAQGLLAARKSEGIPVLISLLTETSIAVAWQAEELLRWTAGGARRKHSWA